MNKKYRYLLVEHQEPVTTLWLNRPEVNNAFDEDMISELLNFFEKLSGQDSSRIVVIRGKGNHFSAGADLNWMNKAQNMSYDKNYSGSYKLARLFYAIYHCPLITIAQVHGGCYGGANGIIAAADYSYATKSTGFVFSEAKLGLVAATIAPYIINKAGTSVSLDWMLSARRIDTDEAVRSGLISKAVDENDMDAFLETSIEILLKNSHQSQKTIKKLVKSMSQVVIDEEIVKKTAEITAEARISSDAQNRIAAFFKNHYHQKK
jgi:methylglutaconyl-CoA hydratase